MLLVLQARHDIYNLGYISSVSYGYIISVIYLGGVNDCVIKKEGIKPMEKKFKVVVTKGDCGVYWTEVVGYYDDYEQASLRAYEMYGSVEEVEKEVIK